MSDQSSGNSLVVASVVLAAAILAGSWMLKESIDAGAAQLAATSAKLQAALDRPSPAPAPRAAARPGRPDPTKKYDINIGGAPTRGPDTASVKIVEWSDFECPFCRRVGPTLDQIEETYGDDVQIAFKHMPLAMHRRARPAHAAAEAAGRQGKFWEMHDLIFANQREMSEAKYEEYATELGLDTDQFKRDVASAQVEQRIDADYAEATKLGVTGTPAFFVNGRFLSGAQPFNSFKVLIDEEISAN